MKRYTIKELLDFDITAAGVNTEVMEPITRQILTYAKNRRKIAMTNIKEAGLPTPQAYRDAYEAKNRNGELITVKSWKDADFSMPKKSDGGYLQNLKEAYATARRFLQDKTSTKEGWEKVLTNFRKELRKNISSQKKKGDIPEDVKIEEVVKETMENLSDYWEIYQYVAAELSVGTSSALYDSKQAQALTSSMVRLYGLDKDKILSTLRNSSEENYKKNVELQGGTEYADEFDFSFRMDGNKRR